MGVEVMAGSRVCVLSPQRERERELAVCVHVCVHMHREGDLYVCVRVCSAGECWRRM